MKCFNHATVDAIAVCRHCGKAICRECLVESEDGVTCQGACAKKVGLLSSLVNRARSEAAIYRRLGVVLAVFGLIIGVFALWVPGLEREMLGKSVGLEKFAYVLYALTAVCIVAGMLCYWHGSQRD